LSDSGTISEESAIMKFPAVSIRTSTERPEAIDAGSIVLGGIKKQQVLNAISICIQTYNTDNLTLPWEYQIKDVSSRVIRAIQSYTGIVNKVIWNKNNEE
jgi:UDP-N-acetylglucosamine 2-epimerase